MKIKCKIELTRESVDTVHKINQAINDLRELTGHQGAQNLSDSRSRTAKVLFECDFADLMEAVAAKNPPKITHHDYLDELNILYAQAKDNQETTVALAILALIKAENGKKSN